MCTLIRYLGFMDTFCNCLVGCSSIILWTHAVLAVPDACFVFLHLHLFSAIEHVSHRKVL